MLQMEAKAKFEELLKARAGRRRAPKLIVNDDPKEDDPTVDEPVKATAKDKVPAGDLG